jgi:nucleotide-binding universal stress UspA family protein
VAGHEARHYAAAGIVNPGGGSRWSFGYGGCRARGCGGFGFCHSGPCRFFCFCNLTNYSAMNAKKILVPVSLTEGSGASLAVATALAQDLAATVVLMHVVLDEASEEKVRAEKALRRLAEKTHPHVPIETVICAGVPAQKIVEKNDELHADAIVMSSHGSCGWLNWLHRQTARNVLRQVSCPVWVISPSPQGKVPMLSLFANRQARDKFPQSDRSAKLFPFPASLRILTPQG